ncbi:uncharacterized protein LOC129576449 [Sitodiplosis mosellana]|uniref:uncharacterized protein LOC129576449 n=1 Tax=Sitodiplosis mosellana TaxID=263140 RepID=UPI0024439084|nr:uncharacterized protein LOC129576449 [Sitodiplosis mosellana]
MFLLSVRCSFSCLLIIALTGLLQIINAESFRPIFNPNIGLKSTAQKITAITTTTTTVRPLTTISATLKSRVSSLTKQQVPLHHHQQQQQQQPLRSPVKPLSSPLSTPPRSPPSKPTDTVVSDSKDAPVAEALRGDPYYRRGYYRRPYYYPSNNLYYNTRTRRRPNPKPYYAAPAGYGYNSPYEDYRFEMDFADQSGYAAPKSKKKSPSVDTGKDYMGVIDTDIGQFYDTQSATYNVAPLKSYEQSGYYSSGVGVSTGAGGGSIGSNLGAGSGVAYSDYSDLDEYKFSTLKPKSGYNALPSRAPIKQTKTRSKYNNYDDNDYRYSSDSSGYGTSAPEIEEITTDPATLAKYNNVYLPQHTIYQTAPKSKPKPKPKITTTTTTTHSPPIRFSDTSIDVLTKPLGSATFNLNLSPGTVYNQPPVPPVYNPIATNYKPIPIQPPATSYGVPIAPPLNSYTYQNAYSNQFNGYPPSNGNNYNINPAQISITNPTPRVPGPFAEPPPINQVQLSNIDVNYNSVQSSYDATPKNTRPSNKRKPAKVNSKRVPTIPPPLNTDEEIVEDEREQNDYTGESYSYFKTMPQPSLPNTYDQEEFHTVKNKRKQPKQSSNFYYERDEKTARTTKRPKQPIEVTLRIPDEDYLDDLVKVVQTTRRPKKKSKQTTSHVLDTEDLRDAYDHNSAYYAKKKNKSRTRHQQNDYENNEDEDDYGDEDYDNDRVSHITSQEQEKTKSQDTGTNTDRDQDPVEPRYWDKSASIYKQYGIRARNDNFPVGSSYEVYGSNGFRPIRKDDRTDIYAASPSNIRPTYVRDIPSSGDNKYSNGNRISTTPRPVTASTTQASTLYVWDGKGELPKNHKMV